MTLTAQTRWHVAAMLGDVDAATYGGSAVLIDSAGVYSPEVCHWCPESRELSRFSIDQCHPTPDGGVGCNPYHSKAAEWFGSPEDLASLARSIGEDTERLCRILCSHDVADRARAYVSIGEYWGMANLDSYPDRLTDAKARRGFQRLRAAHRSGRPLAHGVNVWR